MTHEIVQKFLKGENDAGGTIHALELEIERLQKRIAELEAAQQSVQRIGLWARFKSWWLAQFANR